MEFLKESLLLISQGFAIGLSAFFMYAFRLLLDKIATKLNLERSKEVIQLVENLVETAVTEVSQTYVDNLKDKGKFTLDAQQDAFTKAFDRVKITMSDDVKNTLQTVYSDLDGYLEALIEQTVHRKLDKSRL